MATWLKDAIFYEIYPQSFYDTNGDGIGDFNGITAKLDYIKSLGCNAIWMNPCFDSPFSDAGYDVRDYKKVAERYGTMEDIENLFAEAHKRDMHILLDLVPGHTSEEHAWFTESKKAEQNEYSDRYMWTDGWLCGGAGLNYIAGESPRNGAYIVNFFKCQPALNYGVLNPTERWHKSMYDPACIATREAMKDICRFWLDKGCDGFRVDMADSLVKHDDANKSGTVAVWQDILGDIHAEYPESAFVSEWGKAEQSIKAGFDMDFYLDWMGNGYNSLVRDYEAHLNAFASLPESLDDSTENNSFFKADSKGTCDHFIDEYMGRYEQIKDKGAIALITGNHDTTRISYGLSEDELKLAYAFFLTMPGNPFIYYGDEIAMKFRSMASKEGGFTRTGSRYAILVREEFSCLEFIMNRDTINWILKKLNTGGRIWSIYQRKSIKTASATRWWETTTSPIWSCRRKAAPLGGGAGCTRRFCKNTGPASTMHCFCRKNSGHILLT